MTAQTGAALEPTLGIFALRKQANKIYIYSLQEPSTIVGEAWLVSMLGLGFSCEGNLKSYLRN